MKKLSPIFSLLVLTTIISCTTDPDAPGVEYMPDMYRSPALEAYVDYGTNDMIDVTEQRKAEAGFARQLSRRPPAGTIPYTSNTHDVVFNLPYALKDNAADYELAATMVHSPLQPTKANIEKGRALYTIMCTHCHGATGMGDGTIAKNDFITGIPDYPGKLKDLPEGKMFHTITYGKNLMGSHSSQLNQKERWQVIEWVKCLQKKITEPTYDANGMLIIPAASGAEATTNTTKITP